MWYSGWVNQETQIMVDNIRPFDQPNENDGRSLADLAAEWGALGARLGFDPEAFAEGMFALELVPPEEYPESDADAETFAAVFGAASVDLSLDVDDPRWGVGHDWATARQLRRDGLDLAACLANLPSRDTALAELLGVALDPTRRERVVVHWQRRFPDVHPATIAMFIDSVAHPDAGVPDPVIEAHDGSEDDEGEAPPTHSVPRQLTPTLGD